jgi:hypothetical protein
MRVKPFVMPVMVLVVLLGTVVGSQALGLWSTSGRTAVDLAQLAPADVKGWMTLQQVMDGLPIAQGELYALGAIPVDMPPTTALKDLEELVPGFETTALRDALTARAGGAVTGTASAVAGAGTAEDPSTAEAVSTVSAIPPTAIPHSSITSTPLPPGVILAADQIKGKMTLAEVSQQCAVSLDALLVALVLPPDTDTQAPIKDLVAQGKLTDVAAVQQAVAALQPK